MRTIHKYPIAPLVNMSQFVEMHSDSKILRVGKDKTGNWCVWVNVETENPVKKYEIGVYGTGMKVPPYMKYIGTIDDDGLMWHVFN